MSLKNPMTRPGIYPEAVRLAAQRLNHYANPSPRRFNVLGVKLMKNICLDEGTEKVSKKLNFSFVHGKNDGPKNISMHFFSSKSFNFTDKVFFVEPFPFCASI
jgi:hypothetical protein